MNKKNVSCTSKIFSTTENLKSISETDSRSDCKSSSGSLESFQFPSKDWTFPPEKRLHKSEEFGLVFKAGHHRIRQDSLQLIARTHDSCTCSYSRLGLVVPKKLLKKAVHRNRLKRLVREAFRNWNLPVACDVVVALKQKIDPQLLYSCSLTEDSITKSVQQIFQKLDRYSSRQAQRKKGCSQR